MPFAPAGGIPAVLLPDGRVKVTAPIVWTGTRGDAVLIPAGTISDGATRPRSTGGIVDDWGPGTAPFILHDVLCDAANAWSRAGCPAETRPRFLGPDIDGALRAAMRDVGAGRSTRWLYWVGVRWGALFGSRGRRTGWLSTLGPVLALTIPALLVMLPAVVGALASRALLALVELAAWPWTRQAPTLPGRAARAALEYPENEPPRQLSDADALTRVALAGQGGPAVRVDWAGPALQVGPTSGPQAVVHARRVAARRRDREPAPWCAVYLEDCRPGCQPTTACARIGPYPDYRDLPATRPTPPYRKDDTR